MGKRRIPGGGRLTSQRGLLMLAALWAVVGVAMYSQVTLLRSFSEIRNVGQFSATQQSFQHSEALLDYALRDYQRNKFVASYSGFGGTSTAPMPADLASLYPACAPTNAACFHVLTTGGGPRPPKRFRVRATPVQQGWLEVYVTPPPQDPFEFATGYGISKILLRTGARVEGNVQTDSIQETTPNAAIELETGAVVVGSATVGTGATPALAIDDLAAGALVQGDAAYPDIYGCQGQCAQPAPTADQPAPSFPQDTGPTGLPGVAAMPACNTSNQASPVQVTYCVPGAAICAAEGLVPFNYAELDTGQNCHITLKGDYGEEPKDVVVGKLHLGTNSRLNIQGHVRIKSTGTNNLSSFNWDNNSQVNLLNAGGTSRAVIYASSDVRLGSLSNYNVGGNPAHFEIKVIGAKSFNTGSSTNYHGKIYDPLGTVTIMGSAGGGQPASMVRGAVIADYLVISTDALLQTDPGIPGGIEERLPELDMWRHAGSAPDAFTQ